MRGKLQKVGTSADGSQFALIDSKWFRVDVNPKYLPKDVGVEVEYQTSPNSPKIITMIRPVSNTDQTVSTTTNAPSLQSPKEERQVTTRTNESIRITRMAVINSAINYIQAVGKLDASVEDVLKIADTFFDYVIRKEEEE